MRANRTHFEQIPLEVVKKIAEVGGAKDEETHNDNVILEWPPEKGKPRTAPARSSARKRR
jgi:phenolic acid decarboxylase